MPASTLPWNEKFLQSHGIHQSPTAVLETLRRAIETFPRVPAAVPDQELSEAELGALESVGLNVHPEPRDRESPIAKAAADLATLVEKSLTVKAAAKLLGVDESRIRQRLTRDRSLYGFQWEGEWRIPPFQFTDSGEPLPHLKEVVRALPEGLHPLAAHRWFMLPSVDLYVDEWDRAVSPREWLLLGKPAVVLRC